MIDTHCHIDDPQYAEGFDDFVAQQKAGGVEYILVPAIDAASLVSVEKVCALYPGYLLPAAGLHPENVGPDWETQLSVVSDALLTSPERYIAVGEIGLDYHWDVTCKAEQQEVFRRQLLLARRLNLPVMVHTRDAMADTFAIVNEVADYQDAGCPLYPLRGVLHCFSGSYEMAQRFLALGFYLGIGGVLTFKNSRLSETLARLPLDRLVLETDAPYMAPVPHRGERNESRWMSFVAERLANLYGIGVEEIDRRTTANARALFAIK